VSSTPAGRPNYRLIRNADDFVVLVHGTRSDAEAIRQRIGELLAGKLLMTLSEDKTLVTHLDTGFDSLGFHIQRKCRGDGRRVVLTYPSKQALAAVMRKIKGATGRGTTSLRLADVLWKINPILRAGLLISATACPSAPSPTWVTTPGGE
jgi:RNA-directed DNA polymerase